MLSLLSLCFAGPLDITFDTVDTELDRGTRIRMEYTLWQVRDFYAHRLGIDYPRTIELDVTIYGDQAAYRKVADAAGRPSWSGGWFQPRRTGRHEAVFHAALGQKQLAEVFLHEGSHFLVAYGGRIPRWLNEGLAETLEQAHTEGQALIVRPSSQKRSFLAREGAGRVEDIVLDPKTWSELPRDQAGARYTRAWALTTLLLSTQNGGDTLEAIAVAFRRTGDRSSGMAAIDKTYLGGRAALQRDLDAFAQRVPQQVTVSRTLKGALKTDALWTNCPDGRLVRTDVGCGF